MYHCTVTPQYFLIMLNPLQTKYTVFYNDNSEKYRDRKQKSETTLTVPRARVHVIWKENVIIVVVVVVVVVVVDVVVGDLR